VSEYREFERHDTSDEAVSGAGAERNLPAYGGRPPLGGRTSEEQCVV